MQAKQGQTRQCSLRPSPKSAEGFRGARNAPSDIEMHQSWSTFALVYVTRCEMLTQRGTRHLAGPCNGFGRSSMNMWKHVWRVKLPASRSIAHFVFAFGLGFIFAILSGPQVGLLLTTGALSVHQIFGLTATHNWFPERFERSGVLHYDPARAQPGYTLFTIAPDLSAHLIDMNGNELHRWFVPKEQAIPSANSVRTLFGFLPPQVEGGHLFSNGDLLLVYEVKALNFPSTPVVKIDKDSHIIWRTEVQAHHAIQVVGDKIYALTGITPASRKVTGSNFNPLAYGEAVSVLAEGKILSSHSIFEALQNTKNMRMPEMRLDPKADALHSNSLDVLTEETARFIPGAKPGNVLVSLRNLDMLVVMDLESDTIVWALRGSWRKQHDAKLLPNGHILLFDNEGVLMKGAKSRVLEVDPNTGNVLWSFSGTDDDPLDSSDNRGGAQRLPNGNTLINESNAGRILEVTPDGSVVWEYVTPIRAEENGQKLIPSLGLSVTRYEASYVKFLNLTEKSNDTAH